MHFFHFPFRDLPRCEKWAEYSNNLAFLQLPINQLRNKVVCEMHFKEPCFMNVKHERLTKFAVPTLLRTKTGEVVDFEIDQNNPTIYDVQTTKTSKYYEPPAYKPVVKLLNSKASKIITTNLVREEDAAAAPLVDTTTFEYADIVQCPDVDLSETVEISDEQMMDGEPTLLNGITLTKVDINRFEPDCDNASPPTYTKLKRKIQPLVKSKKTEQPATNNDAIVHQSDFGDDNIEYYDLAPKRPKVAEPADVKIVRSKPDTLVDKTLFVDTMDKQKKEFSDLKQIITAKIDSLEESLIAKQTELLQQTQSVTAVGSHQDSKSSRNTIEAGPTKTKIQLFNGIKKYLNPSMVALLRMEMFGDTERQYKSDEKSLAVELLNVQSNIYEYMRSELRFRLPPKKDAETWAKEMSENGREIDWEDEF